MPRGILRIFLWSLWLLVFFFPFVVLGLAALSNSVAHERVHFGPVLFFYGAALFLTVLMVFVLRAVFKFSTMSPERRTFLIKLVFLIPILPGIAFLMLLILRMFGS